MAQPAWKDTFVSYLETYMKIVVFCDIDWTLTNGFTQDPNQSCLRPGIREEVDHHRGSPRVKLIFITGRTAHNAHTIFNLGGFPVYGMYGAELITEDGLYHRPHLTNPQKVGLRQAAAQLQRLLPPNSGFRFERKPGSVFFDARWCQDDTKQKDYLDRVDALFEGIAATHAGLNRKIVSKGRELVIITADKGITVGKTCLVLPCDVGVVGIGDDKSDEPLFVKVREQGGPAYKVEGSNGFQTCAQLIQPDDVLWIFNQLPRNPSPQPVPLSQIRRRPRRVVVV